MNKPFQELWFVFWFLFVLVFFSIIIIILLQLISEETNVCKKKQCTVIDRGFQKCKDTDASALQRVDIQKRSLI